MCEELFKSAKMQYNIIKANRYDLDVKDDILINCHQMLNFALKGLLKEITGKYYKTSHLVTLMNNIDKDLCEKNKTLLISLTYVYVAIDYEKEDYSYINEEEFNEIVEDSINLYKELLLKRDTLTN